MASGKEVESNRNLFAFFTRKESESNLAKIVRSILSVMVSELVEKAEEVLSGQRHHSSAEDKTIESWKLNHPSLSVRILQTHTGIRLKCPVVLKLKLAAYGPEKVTVIRRRNSVTHHSQSSECGKLSCIQQKICSKSSLDCKTEEQQSSSGMSQLC